MNAALRALDLSDERVSVIVAAARAWMPLDWSKSLVALARAIDADEHRATRDLGLLNFAFDLLAADAVEQQKFDDAARWRRRQAARRAEEFDTPRAVLSLFALHSEFGPLTGFEQDLQTYEDELGRPEVLYAIARMHERAGNSLLACALRQSAIASNLVSCEGHVIAAQWLLEQGWASDATRELQFALSTGHGLEPARKLDIDTRASYLLAQIAAEADDDLTAADRFQTTQDLIDKSSNSPNANLGGGIHRHRLRLARANHDEASVKNELAALLAQSEPDPDASIDLVNYLREIWRTDEASQQFDRAYEAQKARLAGDPANPQEMNNLAWLCARCRQRLPEAIDLATRATQLAPENAGFWDTLAEARFASGNYVVAATLESRALSMKIRDPFMIRQLNRFKHGAQK